MSYLSLFGLITPNHIVLRTSIMKIAFIYFNIVHVMHDAEFIKLTLRAQKCEHNRYTILCMFGYFLSSIVNYVDSFYVIFSILFPLFSEYHVYSTILHIILMASKVFVTNTNVYKCVICLVSISGGLRV